MKNIQKLWKKIVLLDRGYSNNYNLKDIHISYFNINSDFFSEDINTIFFQIFHWYKSNNRILFDINYSNFEEFMYHNNSYYNKCINSFFL